MSIIKDLDVAKSEPVAREACARLANTDGQLAVSDVAQYVVGIATCLEGVAAADDTLHGVTYHFTIFISYRKVGNRAIDVAVLSIDSIIYTYHVLDVGLEEIMDVVSVERSGIVDVVVVVIRSRTECTVYLQLIDAVRQTCDSLIHVHLRCETFGCIKRTGL